MRKALAAAVLLFLTAGPAQAAITRIAGPTDLLSDSRLFVKFDSAFDTTNRVYLVVWGTQASGPVNGIFLNEAGTPVGPIFAISDGAQQSGWARVIYSAAERKFLVSYVKILAVNYHQKIARFVTYAGGTGSLGPEIPLDTWSGGAGNETGIAYSAPSRRFFVTWWRQQGAFPASYVATLDASGTIINSQLLTNLSDGQSDPEIACDPVNRRCFISGWSWGVFNGGKTAVWGRFIDDTLGNPQGADSFYLPASGYLEEPTVTYSAAGSRFVVAYVSAGQIYGNTVNGGDSTVSGSYPLMFSSSATLYGDGGGYGFPTITYNSASKTMMIGALPWSGYPAAQEIDAAGTPIGGSFDFVPNPGGAGTTNPWDYRSKYVIPVANPVTSQFLLIDNNYYLTFRTSRYSTDGSGGGPTPTPTQSPLQVTGFTANTALPADAGTAITWTATTSGGTSPIQYQFMLYTEGSGWVVGQAYGTNNTFTWAPAAGTHAIQVWARSSGSTAAYDAYSGSGYFTIVPPTPHVQSLTANVTFPAALNVPITFTAVASGGTGPIEYAFYRYSDGVGWQLGQPYSSVNTYTIYPPAGNNAVQVWVRTVGSGVNYEDYRGTGMFVVASTPARLTSLTPDFEFYSPVGQPIVFTATGAGGQGPLEYKYFLYSYNTGLWYALTNWTPANYVMWTPSVGMSGQYHLQAWVRTVGSSVQYEDWRGTSRWIITNSTSLSLTSNRSLQGLRAGDAVSFTANVGGTGPWEYRFLTYDGAAWSASQEWSANNVFNWAMMAGTRALQVWVRQVGTLSQWERWQGTGLFIVNP